MRTICPTTKARGAAEVSDHKESAPNNKHKSMPLPVSVHPSFVRRSMSATGGASRRYKRAATAGEAVIPCHEQGRAARSLSAMRSLLQHPQHLLCCGSPHHLPLHLPVLQAGPAQVRLRPSPAARSGPPRAPEPSAPHRARRGGHSRRGECRPLLRQRARNWL